MGDRTGSDSLLRTVNIRDFIYSSFRSSIFPTMISRAGRT